MAKRIKMLEKLAELDCKQQVQADACYELAAEYSMGTTVERDTKLMLEWLTKACEFGSLDAQGMLAQLYWDGEDGVEQSFEKAVEWYQKAAAQGDTQAQYNLGICFCDGTGIEKNLEKAVEWFTKASAQGDAEAQYILGNCYLEGKGVVKNLQQAKRLFKLAARQLNGNAHAALARLEAASGKDAIDRDESPSLLCCHNQGCSISTDKGSAQTANLKSCSRCLKVAYCSTECQTRDWKARHKRECKKLEVREDVESKGGEGGTQGDKSHEDAKPGTNISERKKGGKKNKKKKGAGAVDSG